MMVPTTSPTDLQSKYHLYGWRNFRCGGMLSRPIFAYTILCICTFVQNFSVNGANNAVISTLERVFYLNSVQSGLFLALYDLATVLSAPLVGYLGDLYSSPIFFSLNMIIVAFGNILIGSSNFLNGENRLKVNHQLASNLLAPDNVIFQCYKDPFQTSNFSDISCSREENSSTMAQNAKFLLYFGNFVNGIGSVALFTIGVAYIERIFPREKAAYCQAIYFALGTIGGALGLVATGRFLLLYTKLTPKRRLPSWLTPSHPLWIGCWWLPYIIYGVLCFLIGIFVSGLPNYEVPGEKYSKNTNGTTNPTVIAQENPVAMIEEDSPTRETTISTGSRTPAKEDIRSNLHSKNANQLSIDDRIANGVVNHAFSTDTLYKQLPVAHLTPTTTPKNSQKSLGENWRNMCSVVCQLMKNSRYILIVMVNLFEGILLKGFVPFVTKYFEYQHQLDTSTATLVTGAIALLSVLIGCSLGAYFMNKYSWTPMQCARICAIILIISSFLFLFLTFSCPELKFQHTSCSSTNSFCCHNIYHPVCNIYDPQQMFLSPCHFGCTNQTTLSINSTIHYSSCNCNEETILSESACRFRRIPCVSVFALTLIGATFVVFFTAFIQVPMLQVLLYSVPLTEQKMALALRQTIVRVLGQTTGPLLFGYVFDQSCLVWLIDCFARRTCKVYNNRQMGLSMALSGFFTRFISGIACGVVFCIWKFRHSTTDEIVSNTRPPPTTDDLTHKNPTNEITRL